MTSVQRAAALLADASAMVGGPSPSKQAQAVAIVCAHVAAWRLADDPEVNDLAIELLEAERARRKSGK